MEELISVVVPIFNSRTYLEQALVSLCNQTYRKLEIVLVDDGSTDGSGEVCDGYADRDDRIRVIHQDNAGLTAAWKRGVTESTGDYVGFLDSDDWIEPDMYENMQRRAQEENADIVCCGIHHVFEENTHRPWDDSMKLPREVYTEEQIREELFPVFFNDGSFMGRGVQPNRVSKLVRRSLLAVQMKLCDDRVSVGEDCQFALCIFAKAERVVVMKDYLPYYYRVNRESMTGGYDREYLSKICFLRRQLEHISDRLDCYDFNPQLRNDFLCLCVLHIKSEIVRNRAAGYFKNRRNIKRICNDMMVREALSGYRMPRLTAAERLFLCFMKNNWYTAIYAAVRLYFKDSI